MAGRRLGAAIAMISVIIPTLNEAVELPATLAALAANSTPHDVTVVDAGSTDGTRDLAGAAGAAVLTSARRQRAAQMNLGAAHARGDAFLFLHADTRVAPTTLADLAAALADTRVVGGACLRRFDHPSGWLRWCCWFARRRSRWLGWYFGDQAIFARRTAFEQLGGYREWERFEDLDFARRLKRLGQVRLIGPEIVSSGRRFIRRGPWRTTWRDVWLTLCFLAAGGGGHRNGNDE